MFALEKLKVYDRALTSTAILLRLASTWHKRHAIVDQLVRASESVVLNIAEGARLRGSRNRRHVLDYAIGSTLKCAACLDIALCKRFLTSALCSTQKQALNGIVRMLVGLSKAWSADDLRENGCQYGEGQPLFGHERLEAYQVGLQFVAWFQTLAGAPELTTRLLRQMDKAATSVILNIAEGNGRSIATDRRNFLETAESATVKAATYLDLSLRVGDMDHTQTESGMDLLNRLARLVRGLAELTRGGQTDEEAPGLD